MELRDIYEALETGSDGLSDCQVTERSSRHGPNVLKARKKTSPLFIFLSQFNNLLIYILIGAIVVSFLIGETLDAGIIAVIVILNAILGFVQEYKAEKSIESLQKMIVPEALVIRDGHRIRIPAKDLVPGDIIEVEAGESIPADARILEARSLKVDESPITGESHASEKHSGTLPADTPVGDMENMIFMGTTALDGRSRAAVVNTGMDTEIGKIATLVSIEQKRDTPMQVSLGRLGKFFGISALAVCGIILGAGVLGGRDLYEMFLVSVSLAVAAIPEGLPATVTIVLALGVQKMAKRNAIIRKLPAVETLGSTNVICSDKTGTLTQNIIVVKKVVLKDSIIDITGTGYSHDGSFMSGESIVDPSDNGALRQLLVAGMLCNNSTYEKVGDSLNINGDSTEVALLVAGAKAGMSKVLLEDVCPRKFEIPFNSDTKRMTTVNACDGEWYVYMKGAPEVVLDLCDSVTIDDRSVPLDESTRKYFLDQNNALAENGMRVLGIAYKKLQEGSSFDRISGIESRLTYIGLTGMIDPPRPEVKESVRQCKGAGIEVVMITGDQKPTAIAIARDLGIFQEGDTAISGIDLNEMSDDQLREKAGSIKVYARTSPEQKLRIVKALQSRGKIVSMTGDGVNDAPALKSSDIGIAMGVTGTDVSRQASDMILADDNFSTIVNAVEEGRSIYDNVRKFVKFLFTSNLGEVLTIFLGIILGLPLPLLAIQILWVNLITDGLPALALSVDPSDGDIMKRSPRPKAEGIITGTMVLDMALVGAVISLGTLGVFYLTLPSGEEYARSMAFTTLVFFQLWNAVNCRSERHSMIGPKFFKNVYLLAAIGIAILLQLMILYLPFFEDIFVSAAPSVYGWAIIIGVTSTVFFVVEARKLIQNVLMNKYRSRH